MDRSKFDGDGVSRGDDGFLWSERGEPHALRRKEMLSRYPAIKGLYGPCPRTKYVCALLVSAQLALCFAVKDAPWWLLLTLGFLVGGVMNQSLLLAIHELSHNLAFKSPLANRVFALFANLPIGIPVAGAFRDYHLMHHTDQGVDGVDTDIPSRAEARWVKGPFAKLLWLLGQGLAYGLRPLLVKPLAPTRWVIANIVVQLAFDWVVYTLWGGKALAYLPISTLLTMGLHPMAGHYLTEHYVVASPQETYSYYGPLNLLSFNVGYHNEHHDFPYIAGSRLPRLKAMAPEYYDNLVSHHSWTKMLWTYLTEPRLSATSRIKRQARGHQGAMTRPF